MNSCKYFGLLSGKMNLAEVLAIASEASESEEICEALWKAAHSDCRRVVVNALWVMTHLSDSKAKWLLRQQEELVRMLLSSTDTAVRRLLLQILREQDFDGEKEYTVALLEFCFSKINSEVEPYAIRCFSIYTAFRICKDYPELIDELASYLTLLSYQTLSPGLKSGLRQTEKKIKRLRKSFDKF